MSTCTTAADLTEYFALPDPATGEPVRAGSELGFLRRRVAYLESRVETLEAEDDCDHATLMADRAKDRWLEARGRVDAAMDAEREILASVADD